MTIQKSEIAIQLSVGGLIRKHSNVNLFLLHSTSYLLLVPPQVHAGALPLIFQLPVIPDEDTLLSATSRSCTRNKRANCTSVEARSGDDTLGGKSLAVGFTCSRKLPSDHNFINFRFEDYFF